MSSKMLPGTKAIAFPLLFFFFLSYLLSLFFFSKQQLKFFTGILVCSRSPATLNKGNPKPLCSFTTFPVLGNRKKNRSLEGTEDYLRKDSNGSRLNGKYFKVSEQDYTKWPRGRAVSSS